MKSIDKEAFVNILRKFADDPEDVLEERNRIEGLINGENITLTLSENEDGVLMCEEPDSHKMKVRAWIEKRLARLRDLAERILQIVEEDSKFIPVPSDFDSLDREGGKVSVSKTTDDLFDKLKNVGGWSTEVFYLLSEAGEGKTWIMFKLARLVAEKYLAGEIHFLFLPVGLDGRPFLRFDEVVIGVLTQKYRFRRFYYETIVELAKWGFLVLGLDGFEEMTVEGKENAVISSLGDLLQQHDSKGSLVISARRAFYDYALKDQAPMMDTIRDLQVDFSAYRLRAWGKNEFLALMAKFDFPPDKSVRLYERLVSRLRDNHPILVRPVLARKLVELLLDSSTKDSGDCDSIIAQFSPDGDSQKVMATFVELLLHREASEKWIRFSGSQTGAHQQLLSSSEHAAMLEEIAEEMWLSSMECLGLDVLQNIVELFCESIGKSPAETNDCKQKIVHHAMLTKSGENYFFCHDAFRQYFLGCRIAKALLRNDGIRNELLSRDVLNETVVDATVFILAKSGTPFTELNERIGAIRKGQSRNTPVNQNAANILAGLWKALKPTGVQFENLYFSASTTSDVPFEDVVFKRCAFENLSIPRGATFANVRLHECVVNVLSLSGRTEEKTLVFFDESSIPDKLILLSQDSEECEEFFNPRDILFNMKKRGCSVPPPASGGIVPENQSPRDAALFRAFEKLVRLFMRTTGVSGRVLRMKMNRQWRDWEADFIPTFVRGGLLSEEQWHGSGTDTRYVLQVPFSRYETARAECHGQFDVFCELMKQGRKIQ